MKLIADESVDFGVIRSLRKRGIEAISISEEHAGFSDTEVLSLAQNYQCLLITEDKDFGELAYRLKLLHFGILLIRLGDIPRNERITTATEMITSHFDRIDRNFSVLTKKGLRIKVLPIEKK
jgi:predicted nuclease of predicted toxin-antitoxin system